MNDTNYSYNVIWSDEDQEYVGLCAEFPSLSWLDADRDKALTGIKKVVADVMSDMDANEKPVPRSVQDTLYLLSNTANMIHLQKSIHALENNQGISVKLDDL